MKIEGTPQEIAALLTEMSAPKLAMGPKIVFHHTGSNISRDRIKEILDRVIEDMRRDRKPAEG